MSESKPIDNDNNNNNKNKYYFQLESHTKDEIRLNAHCNNLMEPDDGMHVQCSNACSMIQHSVFRNVILFSIYTDEKNKKNGEKKAIECLFHIKCIYGVQECSINLNVTYVCNISMAKQLLKFSFLCLCPSPLFPLYHHRDLCDPFNPFNHTLVKTFVGSFFFCFALLNIASSSSTWLLLVLFFDKECLLHNHMQIHYIIIIITLPSLRLVVVRFDPMLNVQLECNKL